MTNQNGDEIPEVTPPVTPPEGAPPVETPPPEGGEDDPLTAPNAFPEGSAEHTAFERQREKFKQKLEKERTAIRKEAEAASAAKLDQILEALQKSPETPPEPPAPPANDLEVTEDDVKIVSGALKKIGIDPQQIIAERQRSAQEQGRQEVVKALGDLKAKYGVDFNDQELVKFANDHGISKLGGTPYDILELALIRSKGDLIRGTKAPEPPVPPVPEPEKKEPVKISATKTGTELAPLDNKPRSVRERMNQVKKKYLG